MEDFLRSRGWSTWYHHDYWVNPKVVADRASQDYTNYGMSAERAVEYELSNAGPISPNPLDIFPYWNSERRGKMATKTIKLTGTVEWCKPWPGQIDREYEDPDNGRGGNWSVDFIPDEASQKVLAALGTKAKVREGKIRLRRYERHPVLGDLGAPVVTGVDEGTAIGNGSKAAVTVDVYDYTFKGKPGKAMRWKDIDVIELVEYKKPDVSKPAVGVPVV